MKPGEQYWNTLGPIWEELDIYGTPAPFLEQFSRVPRPVSTLFAAHWAWSEICNGGLHQFFSNPTGVLAPEAIRAFNDLGLSNLADLLGEAVHVFGLPYPRDQGHRLDFLDRYEGVTRQGWDPFYALDSRFFAALDSETARFERAADAFAGRHGG